LTYTTVKLAPKFHSMRAYLQTYTLSPSKIYLKVSVGFFKAFQMIF